MWLPHRPSGSVLLKNVAATSVEELPRAVFGFGDMSFRENTAGDAGGGMFFLSRQVPCSRWTFEKNRAAAIATSART